MLYIVYFRPSPAKSGTDYHQREKVLKGSNAERALQVPTAIQWPDDDVVGFWFVRDDKIISPKYYRGEEKQDAEALRRMGRSRGVILRDGHLHLLDTDDKVLGPDILPPKALPAETDWMLLGLDAENDGGGNGDEACKSCGRVMPYPQLEPVADLNDTDFQKAQVIADAFWENKKDNNVYCIPCGIRHGANVEDEDMNLLRSITREDYDRLLE